MKRRASPISSVIVASVLVLCSGCGRISFAVITVDGAIGDAATGDASADGGLDSRVSIDGAVDDGAIADALLPDGLVVGEVATVPGLTSPGAADRSPVLRADLLEIYFSSNRAGGAGSDDIWRATRSDASEPWNAPAPVTELNTAAAETHPTLSRDGLILMFSRTTSRGANIMTATRADAGSPWGSPTEQAEINSGAFDGCPTLSPDASEIVFCSQRRGGTQDLHTAARSAPTDPFGVVNFLGPLSSASTERGPFIGVTGGLRILFASDRPGGAGGFDIYESSRLDTGSAWGLPTPVPTVNGPANDEDPWTTDDGRLLFFSSDRSGDYEIHVAAVR